MARFHASVVLLFAFLSIQVLFCLLWVGWESMIRMPVQKPLSSNKEELGIRWAVLVTGSSGYKNYRYKVLRKEGLKEENIVVFMYDDLANNIQSPDIIINHPKSQDIYVGIPQDYTGNQVTTENLYAVLLGNKSAVRGGSGKVVDSKSNDQILVYYFDHGGPSVLGMPNLSFLFADDFISLLKKKHESKKYKEMVIYFEACKSGNIFEGVIPQDLNIYVIIASSAKESNWGTYCLGMDPSPLSDESSNLKLGTKEKKHQMVKERTSKYNTHAIDSENNLPQTNMEYDRVKQTEIELLYLWTMYRNVDEDKAEAIKEIKKIMKHRLHIDNIVDIIGKLIFGYFDGPSILQRVRSFGQQLVDDWDCVKSTLKIFETHCGPLTFHEMHSRAFINICNMGISMETVKTTCISVCADYYYEKRIPSRDGYNV